MENQVHHDDPMNYGHKSFFNILIHEYLLKNDYLSSADTFKDEANIKDYAGSNSTSILFEWFTMFNDICKVRSGNYQDSDNLSRIESIMMKLESDKSRLSTYPLSRPSPPRSYQTTQRDPRAIPEQNPRYYFPRYQEPPNPRLDYPSSFRKAVDQRMQMIQPDNIQRMHQGRPEMPAIPNYPQVMDDRNNIEHYPRRIISPKQTQPIRKTPQFQREDTRQTPNINAMNYTPQNFSPNTMNRRKSATADLAGTEAKKVSPKSPQKKLKEIKCILLEKKLNCSVCKDNFLILAFEDTTIHVIDLITLKTMRVFDTNIQNIKTLSLHIIQSYSDSPVNQAKILICTNSRERDCTLYQLTLDGKIINSHTLVLKNPSVFSQMTENGIYIFRIDGNLCKFNFIGELITEAHIESTVKEIVHYKNEVFIVSSRQRVFTYDLQTRKVLNEISNEPAQGISTYNGLFAILYKEMIELLSPSLQRIRVIPLMHRLNCIAIFDENNIFTGVYRKIYWHHYNSLITFEEHNSTIISLEVYRTANKTRVVSLAQHGEIKICEF